MTTQNKTQILIPIDVANDLLGILATTAPRGQAHAEELLRVYHSLAVAVSQTAQRTR